VQCPNPACGATVPLVRQTWLAKKTSRFTALKLHADPGARRVRFEVVTAASEQALGFDPAGFSERGNARCPFCGSTVQTDYVKGEGKAGRIGTQPMAVVCTTPGKQGKTYVSADALDPALLPDEAQIAQRIEQLCAETGLTVPDEPIEANPRSMDTQNYGFKKWSELFTSRQMLVLLTFVKQVRAAHAEMVKQGYEEDLAKAIASYLAMTLDKLADANNSLCRWEAVAQCARAMFSRQSVPMVWDFGENVPVGQSAGSWIEHATRALDSIKLTIDTGHPAAIARGSATSMPFDAELFDAIITDPPYYDNVSYSNLADFFYVWLKRSAGFLYADHLTSDLTPKKKEAIAATYRHGGTKEGARKAYESLERFQ
jgi:putative DNA methylase